MEDTHAVILGESYLHVGRAIQNFIVVRDRFAFLVYLHTVIILLTDCSAIIPTWLSSVSCIPKFGPKLSHIQEIWHPPKPCAPLSTTGAGYYGERTF
jgi:hypothetical protein